MDATDRKILDHVQRRGRDTYAEIGETAGLSVSAVNERLRKLEARGIIRAWRAEVDAAAMGRPVLAFVQVELAGAKEDTAFRKAIKRLPEVLECHAVTGAASYLLKLRAGSLAEVEALVAETLRPMAGVARVESWLATSTVKETGMIPPGSA
jgi:Lrp/AsnC family transcriptional regulator, leucine-responsive regulatory protein